MKQRNHKPLLKMLSQSELERLNTKRLLGVLKSIRAVEQSVILKNLSEHWCCEVCKEYMGINFYSDCLEPAKHLTLYKNKVKAILSTRENI